MTNILVSQALSLQGNGENIKRELLIKWDKFPKLSNLSSI